MNSLTPQMLVVVTTIFTLSSAQAQSWAESMAEMLSQYPGMEDYKFQDAIIREESRSDCNPAKGGIHGGARAQDVTIFGDGNERNGYEDDRKSVVDSYEKGLLPDEVYFNALGTIRCNGKVVGSSEILNVDHLTGKKHSKGFAVGVTVAHVLRDDETGKDRTNCYYHPLDISKQRYKITKKILGRHGKKGADGKIINNRSEDWAAFVLEEDIDTEFGAFHFTSKTDSELDEFQRQGGSINLVGYNHTTQRISVTLRNCGVVNRQPGDLLYGRNEFLVDSCDSNGGASGGGLVANYKDKALLLGVDIGGAFDEKDTNHDGIYYPGKGPIPGEPFDPKNNVNYSIKFQGDFLSAIKTLARHKNPIVPNIQQNSIVLNIQQLLSKLGFDVGPADGIMGMKTRAAIRLFQSSNGIEPTGEPSKELLIKLQQVQQQLSLQ